MLRGDWRNLSKAWRIALSLALAATIAGSSVGWGLWQQAEYERKAQHRSAEHARDASNYIRNHCIASSILDKIDCATKARDEHRSYQRNEQDLVAQKTSALWTMIMGWAATFGMVLSAVGIYLVWTTFAETRRANEIAREAQRPWVRLGIMEEGSLRIEADKITLIVDMLLENFGSAPALDVWSDGVLSFDRSSLADLSQTLAEAAPTTAHARTALFQGNAEGTQHILEFDGEIPDSGILHLLAYCQYRVPGETVWRFTADIQEVRPNDAATRFYGMTDDGLMKFKVGATTLEARKIRHKRALGMRPIAT